MGELSTNLIINIVTAAIILVVGWWIAKLIQKLITGIMRKKNVDAMLTSFTSNVVYTILFAFVIIAALGKLGVQTTSIIAVLGAAGLAVGLALQGSLSNFASGILIIFFRPFKVDDFVEVAGITGIVEGIQFFSTQLRTGDNKAVIVPNSSITSNNITNYSAKEQRRVDMVFGISYDNDLKIAKIILGELVDQDERILKDPAPVIAVSELGDNSVNIIVRPWVKTADYWNVYWDMLEKVKLRFDEENISIPYPQRDVHLYQAA